MDAALDTTGDLRADFERHRDPLAALAQAVRLALEGHRDDWPFDLSAGLPHTAWREHKPPRLQEIGALIRREIRAVPGVERIDGWTASWDPEARRLSFGCTIIAADGAVGLEFVPLGANDGNHFPALYLMPGATPIAPVLA